MITESLTIINKFGLHTRAAAKLVNIAQHYSSHIHLVMQDKKADAKSIMNLITLGATCGSTLQLIIEGEDEVTARDAVTSLIQNRFGEAE
jgi:phosphocarrier protein HPr